MSIGWLAEDVAEITGTVIGAWDYPALILRKKKYLSPKNQNLDVDEPMNATGQVPLLSALIKLKNRIVDCEMCENQILIALFSNEIHTSFIHDTLELILKHIRERQNSLSIAINKLNIHKTPIQTNYKPSDEDVYQTVCEIVLKSSLVYICQGAVISNTPFWKILDDYNALLKIWRRKEQHFLDFALANKWLTETYIKCSNCHSNLYSLNNSKIFPYCFECNERRKEND